jgi:Fic family protein
MPFDPALAYDDLPPLPPKADVETKAVLRQAVSATRAVTEDGAWEPWVLYMLGGVEETSLWTIGRIRAIRELLDATIEKCRVELPKVYSKELIELIFRQPYCKISFVVEAGIAERKTASAYLRELERIGLLQGEKRGRETVYRHPALLMVLTA